MSKPLFSLLHATDRHPQWRDTAELWLERCDEIASVEHVIVTGGRTRHLALADMLSYKVPETFPMTRLAQMPESRGGTDQWNKAAELSTGHILIKIADDLFPPMHWDSIINRAFIRRVNTYDETITHLPLVLDVGYRSREDGPLLDCGTLIPHAILTRPYYERFGYLEHPDYSHNMADVEFSDVAHASGCVIKRHDVVFIHKNPEDGSAEWDEVYRRQRTPEKLAEARAIYEKRKALGFPKESVLPLKCEAPGPMGWKCEALRGHTGDHCHPETVNVPPVGVPSCTV